MIRRRSFALRLVTVLWSTHPAEAQMSLGGPDQPDTPLDARTRAAVVESLIVRMQTRYVFPEKAAEVAKVLRRRLTSKEYDRITSSKEFADTLLTQMQAVTRDFHTRVHYRAEPFPPMFVEMQPSPQERAQAVEDERRMNFGFERVQRLAGNVGYLDLRNFSDLPESMPTAVAAMNFLGSTDAMIVDLRRNGGGSTTMIQMLLSWFTPANAPLHYSDFYHREGNRTEQFHSLAYVPGPRFNGKPLFVLISPRTGSAAEEFAYDVQTHGLGKLYGETTAGAANPGELLPLTEHFAAFIATGRSINTVTKTNWEGVGVKPDVAVPPGDALREAHTTALQQMIEREKAEPRRMALQRALEFARRAPSDPAAEFAGPQRRRG